MSPESDLYKLTWDTVSTIIDISSLLRDWNYHKNRTSETSDNSPTSACVHRYKNGWWYGNCVTLFLNGAYNSTPTATYSSICIVHFKDNLSLKGASMMFRPTDYTRPCNNPCKNGGTCHYVVASNGRRCECPLTYCGATCEKNNLLLLAVQLATAAVFLYGRKKAQEDDAEKERLLAEQALL